MPYDAIFDARTIEPRQGGGPHPVGNKFPFTISHTSVEAVKTEQGQPPKGGKFVVEFTSPAGSIKENYNLWNENETARKIAAQELSALCHATGIFNIDFKNDGAALRGAQGLMDIGFQKGHEPSAEKPEGGYVELKKVYDRSGNEPGKAQQAPQGQQGGGQPNGQVVSGFQANNASAAPAAAWGGGQQTAAQPQQPTQQPTQGWVQGTTEKPPWG
jgi:hypothetical protein